MFLNHIDHHSKNAALHYMVVASFLGIVGLPSEKNNAGF